MKTWNEWQPRTYVPRLGWESDEKATTNSKWFDTPASRSLPAASAPFHLRDAEELKLLFAAARRFLWADRNEFSVYKLQTATLDTSHWYLFHRSGRICARSISTGFVTARFKTVDKTNGKFNLFSHFTIFYNLFYEFFFTRRKIVRDWFCKNNLWALRMLSRKILDTTPRKNIAQQTWSGSL